jgi:hypothetical protein
MPSVGIGSPTVSSWDRTLQGDLDRIDVPAGESVLVQGAVRSGTVGARGLLNVYGTVVDLTVGRGGQFSCAGTVAGVLEIEPEGFAMIQGTLVGTVRNAGVVILDGIVTPGGGIEGPGRVGSINDVPPQMRAMLPQVETRIECPDA